MKVGDLALFRGTYTTTIGIVLYDNAEGGTYKIYDMERGETCWVLRKECEVLSEARRLGANSSVRNRHCYRSNI